MAGPKEKVPQGESTKKKPRKADEKAPVDSEIKPYLSKPSDSWKYATTAVRADQAWRVGSVFFNKDKEGTLLSPSASYPEIFNVLKRERVKPKTEKEEE